MWGKEKWDELAAGWEEAGPPATPSAEDVEHFRELLEGQVSHGDSILLLGCTPSLRRMLVRAFRSCNVVCVDFSEKMYERTAFYVPEPNPRESFVLCDWLALKYRCAFGAALGDKALDNIHPEHWRSLFDVIHDALVPEGVFVAHLALAHDRYRGVSPREVFQKWCDLVVDGSVDLDVASAGLWEDLLTSSAFARGEYFNTVVVDRWMPELQAIETELARSQNMTRCRKLFERFRELFSSSWAREWSSYRLEDLETAAAGRFIVDRVVYSHDYEAAATQPLIRWRRLGADR